MEAAQRPAAGKALAAQPHPIGQLPVRIRSHVDVKPAPTNEECLKRFKRDGYRITLLCLPHVPGASSRYSHTETPKIFEQYWQTIKDEVLAPGQLTTVGRVKQDFHHLLTADELTGELHAKGFYALILAVQTFASSDDFTVHAAYKANYRPHCCKWIGKYKEDQTSYYTSVDRNSVETVLHPFHEHKSASDGHDTAIRRTLAMAAQHQFDPHLDDKISASEYNRLDNLFEDIYV